MERIESTDSHLEVTEDASFDHPVFKEDWLSSDAGTANPATDPRQVERSGRSTLIGKRGRGRRAIQLNPALLKKPPRPAPKKQKARRNPPARIPKKALQQPRASTGKLPPQSTQRQARRQTSAKVGPATAAVTSADETRSAVARRRSITPRQSLLLIGIAFLGGILFQSWYLPGTETVSDKTAAPPRQARYAPATATQYPAPVATTPTHQAQSRQGYNSGWQTYDAWQAPATSAYYPPPGNNDYPSRTATTSYPAQPGYEYGGRTTQPRSTSANRQQHFTGGAYLSTRPW